MLHGQEQATMSLTAAGYIVLDAERMTPDLGRATELPGVAAALRARRALLIEAWQRECRVLGL